MRVSAKELDERTRVWDQKQRGAAGSRGSSKQGTTTADGAASHSTAHLGNTDRDSQETRVDKPERTEPVGRHLEASGQTRAPRRWLTKLNNVLPK